MISWLLNRKKTPATLPVSKPTVPAQDLPSAPKSTLSSNVRPTPTLSEVASGIQVTPEMSCKSLRRSLIDLLEPSQLDGHGRQFLPARHVRAFATRATVRSVLPNATQEVIDFVCDRAPKLLLALILESGAHDELESLMKACWEHEFTDELLPVDPAEFKCTGDELAKCGEAHAKAFNVFHNRVWKYIHCYKFQFDQGTFLAPIFTRDRFVYKLGAQCVLPITRTSKVTGSGHFSTVFEAWVHPDHHDVRPDPEGLRVALKELRHLSNEPKYNVEDAWENEATALEKISGLRHNHLIQPLAANVIKRGSDFYIMFEWADGGSLRTLWEGQGREPKDLDADRVICFLEEVSGLAGALSALHNTNRNTKTAKAVDFAKFSNAKSKVAKALPLVAIPNTSAKKPRAGQKSVTFAESPLISLTANIPGISFQEASDDEGFRLSDDGSRSYYSDESDISQSEAGEDHWRHGDLKPDNILKVLSSNTELASKWLGTLKIADLGLAKQHFEATQRRIDPTTMEYTTNRYEAPEANRFMGISRNPRSRRFDIWSMGCILLEFVIVLLYGNKGLEAFYAENENLDPGTETLYFTVDKVSTKARVSMVASHWIKHILNDPECKRLQSALGDVVRLVRDRLLVVELPREGMSLSEVEYCRADAAELQERLETIWKKARDDEENKGDYLFATKNRSGMPIPLPLGRATPNSTAATSAQNHLGDELMRKHRGPLV